MNVLYISYDGALDPLGPSQITSYIIGLSQKGIKFTLLTYEKKDKLDNISKVVSLKKTLKDRNIKWEILRYHKSPTVSATAFDIILGIIRGIFIVLRDRITIIHARSFVGAVPALFLAKLFRLEFIYDNRGFYPEERVDGNIWKNNGFLYKAAKWWEYRFLINTDWIICLTERAREIISALPFLEQKKNIVVIPTCADTDRFIMKDKNQDLVRKLNLKDRFVFIYSGSLGTWYMLEEMLDFFKIAKQINSNSFFLFLTPFIKIAKEKIIAKGINHQDFHVEFVPFEEINDWMSLADAGIFFIKPMYSKKNSCPTKFAETLACGLPVVINSEVGDTDAFVEKYCLGVVINEFNINRYLEGANKLFNMIRSEEGHLRNRCRRVAEDFFSLNKGIDMYWDIYQKLIPSKKPINNTDARLS